MIELTAPKAMLIIRPARSAASGSSVAAAARNLISDNRMKFNCELFDLAPVPIETEEFIELRWIFQSGPWWTVE